MAGKEKPKILLVNPAIYDFTAYDFWLKPFALLKLAGMLKGKAELYFFDFLDRSKMQSRSDEFGRGKFEYETADKPMIFENINRIYKRFGLKKQVFEEFLKKHDFDFALVATTMTYWYPGVKEAVESIRRHNKKAKIIIGGVYATLCREHAARVIKPDLIVEGSDLKALEDFINIELDLNALPEWSFYDKLEYGIIKLSEGCPFSCSYCASSLLYKGFKKLEIGDAISQLEYFERRGIRNIAFYDDALLYKSDELFVPFLEKVIEKFGERKFSMHTPNALHARFFDREIARLMIKAGFKTFFFGYESSSYEWHRKADNKVYFEEVANAVKTLFELGVGRKNVTLYTMIAHPEQSVEEAEESIKHAKKLGAKVMLSEFSPIPKTRDFKKAMEKANLPEYAEKEPLYQNKTAYPIFLWGEEAVNRLKLMAKSF